MHELSKKFEVHVLQVYGPACAGPSDAEPSQSCAPPKDTFDAAQRAQADTCREPALADARPPGGASSAAVPREPEAEGPVKAEVKQSCSEPDMERDLAESEETDAVSLLCYCTLQVSFTSILRFSFTGAHRVAQQCVLSRTLLPERQQRAAAGVGEAAVSMLRSCLARRCYECAAWPHQRRPGGIRASTHSRHQIQCLEPDDSEYYVPDRIIHFTGDASPKDPWPEDEAQQKKGEDDAV